MLKMWRVLILFAFFETAIGGYTFYRRIREKELDQPVTRRLFGGQSVNPSQYPNLVVLVDHAMAPKCTGSIIARRWVVTAAHCATPEMAYVRYNFKSGDQSDLAPVHLLYQHPKYRVVTTDVGSGEDVVILQHDVGLVRTRTNMILPHLFQRSNGTSPNTDIQTDVLEGMKKFSTDDMINADIEILGYGRTENTSQGSELRSVKLRVAKCDRSAESWLNCACGLGDARGVCAGDSGGPVMHQGKQVGVTSMGPINCSPVLLMRGGDNNMSQVASSVFTSLHPYADLINDTILDTEDTIKMRVLKTQFQIENSAERSQLFGMVLFGSYVWVRLN